MKIARIVPLFKSGDQRLFQNYRPISILHIFSKLLERVVYKRILDYINESCIFFTNQYGFRKNHSTYLALIHLCDKITSAIDRKEFTIGIFLDLSKAFDTVNHDILFDKLWHYGIRGVALTWMKSYLANRLQFVQYNNSCSSYKVIQCGVPQGSILGPLLFLLYISDIGNVSNILELILFADDTNLFFSHNDLYSLTNIVNCEIERLSEWFKANKLSINIKKCNYMIFKPRQKRIHTDFSVLLNDCAIVRVKEIVFLGVILNEHISWKPHISHVARKILKSIGIIYKTSFLFSKSSLRKLYYSLVYPYLQYCITIWGSTYPSNLKRIILLQKRMIRILNKEKFDAHTDPIFSELKILKFDKIYLYQLGKFMYLYHNNLLPSSFNNLFPCMNQIHKYGTRFSYLYRIPSCRT